MYERGSLQLTLATTHGRPLGEWVDIRLRNTSRCDARVQRALIQGPLLLSDLKSGPDGSYDVEIFPASFERRRRRVQIAAGQTTDLCIVFYGRGHRGCPEPSIPDHLDEPALTSELGVRLAGTPADGSRTTSAPPQTVVWVENGDEVLVHLDSAVVRILDGLVLVSVDLETDQTGRTPLVVSFSVGSANDAAGLVAVTDEFPRGNGRLASRWGRALQAAAWTSLLGLAQDHATERGLAPAGITAVRGKLSLTAGAALRVTRAAT
jgi:hypothetical protein